MCVGMYFLAESDLWYVVSRATPEGKAIIVVLVVFSIFAWSVMAGKALQMRRAKTLNRLFDAEFRTQKHVMDVYDRGVSVPVCPLFVEYPQVSRKLDGRIKAPARKPRKR